MSARLRLLALAVALGAAGGGAGAVDDAPAEPPQRLAREASHGMGAGAAHGVGLHPAGFMGRSMASVSGVSPSSAMVGNRRDGPVWTSGTPDARLARPEAHVPRARIAHRAMAGPADRAALTAWLRHATAEDRAAAQALPPGIYGGALALAGDPAYGEYLASECVTCHQLSGRADGIPSIVGWPKEAFVQALFAYKTNVRSHEVMRMVTMSLGDEEIASLAAYFGALKPE
jgi:cytochrome c